MIVRGKHVVKRRPEGLMVTSLMDVFVILLLFLMKNYSAEGSILTNADNLVLPNSSAKKKPQDVSLQVQITPDMVLIDNAPLLSADEVRAVSPGAPVPRLKAALDQRFAREQEMVKRGDLFETAGQLVVQADKSIDFGLLMNVLTTCDSVGYAAMRIAVMERDY
jgi:biopolymer transport protein ExbD